METFADVLDRATARMQERQAPRITLGFAIDGEPCTHWLTLPDPGYPLPATAYICPACRHCWAHTQLRVGNRYWPIAAGCIQCQWSDALRPVPGSLLDNPHLRGPEDGMAWRCWSMQLLNNLPEPLLRREFELHLQQASKGFHYL